jgi:hypothetical protein
MPRGSCRRSAVVAAAVAGAILSGCSDGTATVVTDDSTDARGGSNVLAATSDRQALTLAAIPQHRHRSICSGGKLHCKARARTLDDGQTIQSFAAAAIQGFGPADLASAYNVNTSPNPGATVAVVDAYGYPNAANDLATYRSQFGLPPCTAASGCLTIVNQNGQTSPLPSAPSANDDWTIETALDLQMASAACPNCKLLLVEADNDEGDGLFIAQQTAATLGATVISNSWGGADTTQEGPALEVYFDHPGVGEFVASGDMGYDQQQAPAADYPATSAYVTAVGGTSLAKSSGTPRGWVEGAWGPYTPQTGAGGSSCSQDIPKPSWQTNTVCAFRAASDVAAVADPNTGVAVYNNGPSSSGWIVVGGTSVASPFVAGVYALTGNAAAGPSFSYANPTDFYDVTTGSNDNCGNIMCNCGPGWDGPTGNGTPNGAALAGSTCTPQCSGKQCGTDGCGGSCGTCPSGDACSSAGQCVAGCTPSCNGMECGSDGCGGSCGACPSGELCNASGQCVSTCTPNCANKQCGNDGCGGSCGTCPSGDTCNSTGQCVPSCTPSCGGNQCGSDGCGGTCGTCPTGDTCNDSGQCVSSCAPSCAGLQCGSDGCGGSCGTCPSGDICNAAGQCAGGSACSHPICSTGASLTPSCDPCATVVCEWDPYCCTTAWDYICVSEVSSFCGESCGGRGTCSHSLCATGKPLKMSCAPCANAICSEDPYCCGVKWDAQCVGEVSWICGESC